MAHNNYGPGQVPQPPTQWKESAYQFTQPIRYFKSNDPYYWQVDNIPLEQLEKNVLWLRDQIGGGSVGLLSGIERNQINELRPFADDTSFKAFVKPGRYTARINDAYKKKLIDIIYLQSDLPSVTNPGMGDFDFKVSENFIKTLAGEVTGSLILNNGLYDAVLHHVCTPYQGFITSWTGRYGTYSNNALAGMDNLPLIKKTTIRQEKTSDHPGTASLIIGNTRSDLQQLFSDFIKWWGGTARTAVVNVPETLSIEVAPFDAADFMNQTDFEPSYRIDLLFIYSHPIDASSTTILKKDGAAPAMITEPQLGIVKGAGAIGLKGNGPNFGVFDTYTDGTSWIGNSSEWTTGKNIGANYFSFVDSEDYQYGYNQIAATVADQIQDVAGMEGYYGNFPSPDDLLNIAPLLQIDLETNNLALIGQSVLPLAYIIVKKDATAITAADILDIRPFLRTTELAYNERAGIAAANPPLSFANPAVGKEELGDTIRKVRAEVIELIPSVPEIPTVPRVVGSGYIFGGLKYGVEGALLKMAMGHPDWQNIIQNPSNAEARYSWLINQGHVPGGTSLRELPDWEVAPWVLGKNNAGSYRNDRTWLARQQGSETGVTLNNASIYESFHDSIDALGAYKRDGAGAALAFCRKKIQVDTGNVPWMSYYDVIVEFVNCVPTTVSDWYHRNSSDSDDFWPRQYAGLTVSKEGNSFTVMAAFNSFFSSRTETQPGINHPWADNNPGSGGYNKNMFSVGNDWYRNAGSTYPNFAVTHSILDWDQNNPESYSMNSSSPASPVIACTYPTVKYTIMGYPSYYRPDTDNREVIYLK